MAFIHKETFNILQEIPDGHGFSLDDYFECDDLIAMSIRELNKKGYTTRYCCSGHPYQNEGRLLIKSEAEANPFKYYINDPSYEIYRVDSIDSDKYLRLKDIYAYEEDEYYSGDVAYYLLYLRYTFRDTYIMFDGSLVNEHSLKTIPDGWVIDPISVTDECCDFIIRYCFNNIISPIEFIQTQVQIMSELYTWVKSLPVNTFENKLKARSEYCKLKFDDSEDKK